MKRKTQPVRIGTRGSPLARWQADWVQAALEKAFPERAFEQVVIRTSGDVKRDLPLVRFGGVGIFTRELDHALIERRIDLAVHSAKDYPTDLSPDLEIGAYPAREVPNDSLIARKGARIEDLPEGAVIGTGSLRRSAQLAWIRGDLRFAEIRGNIDTRLGKLEAGQYDGIIMAEAAMRRLGLDTPRQVLPVSRIVPAAGEGALMIVCRRGDKAIRSLLDGIDDETIHRCVTAERAVLLGLGGGCRLPIGVYARITGKTMRIRATVLSADGRRKQSALIERPAADPQKAADKTVKTILKNGGRAIVEAFESEEANER